ncbi:MAG: di-trans,poly-cis-decaprenylcistransferase [Desulfobacterales bacterium C00003106]|jgi:undecaprenyl diphosphate synthase|nr:MAG: di-trans,poly-cis-decaprenylcistransferase [Desulfobacterales bacterium C00003106]OEU59122.1 MAG: di-trans,poly-cis-decaprenylcistransferase [Desulfobacterales bacterium C00003104]
MDGNGRWAKKRLLNRVKGHEEGTESVRVIVRTCREIGIEVLTLYAFSTENWRRPKYEVKSLMAILKRFLISELNEMLANKIRFNAIGQIERMPGDVQAVIRDTMAATSHNKGMVLNLALSYGSRDEIVLAVQKAAADVQNGLLAPDDLTPDLFSEYLYTKGMPDPDLLIRTSGEMRISNFLLWQIAYSEIYITDILWPDFRKEALLEAVRHYRKRERRFGMTTEQKEESCT